MNDREKIIADAPDPVVRNFLRMADDSMVAILPYALSVAARLGIADMCTPSGRSVKELADPLRLQPDYLRRLMRTLAGCGFFAEDDAGRFSVTSLGQLLRSDSPVSMRATLSNTDSYRAWLHAADAGMTRLPAFADSLGAEFFIHKEVDPAAGGAFDKRMEERSGRFYVDISTIRMWRSARCVLDVGGGMGVVLASILEATPSLKGILFDRPAVLARAETSDVLNSVRHRCEMIAGDFFDELPTGADVHLLCSILHDWDDDNMCHILKRCRAALHPAGRIIICEMLIPEDKLAHPARWSDLGMMVTLGGRERSLTEYRALLRSCALKITDVIPLLESPFSVIEAVPG
jgi:hypothetical protein